MDAQDFKLAASTIILLQRVRERKFKIGPRKQWVSAIFKEKEEKGAYYQLVNDMRINDWEFYFK